jgi:hypothetical protein
VLQRQENNDAFNNASMPCTVHVWELVMPMEMARKLTNLDLAFYLKVGEDSYAGCLALHTVWLPINAQDYCVCSHTSFSGA